MKSGYSNWRKLDNAALAFPPATDKNDTRVFRMYCELKETVDPEILQTALDHTMEKYPLFQVVLRKGLFWFYLERRDIRAVAKKEVKPPCSRLYIPDKKSLLFEVSYYENRINFEVYHALTDGTGARNFLQELVQNYLKLQHPETRFPETETRQRATFRDHEEDSFSQYYSSETPKNKEKNPRAVRLKGEMLGHDDMQILEISIPVKEILDKARSYGASITAYLSAIFICSIHEEIPRNRQKRPVTLMVPVNLRNFFPSESMANFFGWIEVGYTFTETTTFQDVLEDVKKQFETELVKEKIAMHMNGYVRLEKNPVIRAVPLEVKKYFLMVGAALGSRRITTVYSNIGVVRFPKEYEQYIERFGFFTCTEALQLCSCSYGDELLLGFTSKIPGENIQRNFLEYLKKGDLPHLRETLEQILKQNVTPNHSWRSIRQLFERIYRTGSISLAAHLDEGSPVDLLNCNIQQMVEVLMERFREILSNAGVFAENPDNRLIASVCDYIGQHYAENISLTTVAEHVGYSSKYMSRLFKESMNWNLSDYINYVRIEKAKELLRTTNEPIDEIQELVGIPSRTTFLRVFKKFEGITPGQYRKLKSTEE